MLGMKRIGLMAQEVYIIPVLPLLISRYFTFIYYIIYFFKGVNDDNGDDMKEKGLSNSTLSKNN